MGTAKAYEKIIDFIAAGTTPDDVIDYQPSNAIKQRVEELIYYEKVAVFQLKKNSN